MPTKKEKFIVDDSVVVPEISHALRQFLNDEFPEIKGEEYKITHVSLIELLEGLVLLIILTIGSAKNLSCLFKSLIMHEI